MCLRTIRTRIIGLHASILELSLLVKSGTFFFLFCLKLGLRGSVFAMRSPPSIHEREFRMSWSWVQLFQSLRYDTFVVDRWATQYQYPACGVGDFWLDGILGYGRVVSFFAWLVGWLEGIVCFSAHPGVALCPYRTRRGREGIYHKGTIRALSRIFCLSTCVCYREQLRFRYRSSTLMFFSMHFYWFR